MNEYAAAMKRSAETACMRTHLFLDASRRELVIGKFKVHASSFCVFGSGSFASSVHFGKSAVNVCKSAWALRRCSMQTRTDTQEQRFAEGSGAFDSAV